MTTSESPEKQSSDDYLLNADPQAQLVLILFAPDIQPNVIFQPSANTHYLPCVISYLQRIAALRPQLAGQVVATMHDAVWSKSDSFPLLCFGRPVGQKSCSLIPDPFFLNSTGYLDYFEALNRHSIPWEDRKEVGYFRGASTGGFLTFRNWRNNRRVQLAQMSAAHPEHLDARITTIVQEEEPGIGEELTKAGITSAWERPETCLNYKYLIEIDGNANSWGFFLKFLMGQLIFKVESIWEQWFYQWLIPWEHFVPVKPDLSDLIEKIEWARSHDDEARKIAANGNRFARKLTYDRSLEYGAEVIGDVMTRCY